MNTFLILKDGPTDTTDSATTKRQLFRGYCSKIVVKSDLFHFYKILCRIVVASHESAGAIKQHVLYRSLNCPLISYDTLHRTFLYQPLLKFSLRLLTLKLGWRGYSVNMPFQPSLDLKWARIFCLKSPSTWINKDGASLLFFIRLYFGMECSSFFKRFFFLIPVYAYFHI